MKKISRSGASVPASLGAAMLFALIAFTGCESTGGGSAQTNVYYGVGFHDPWYHGHYYDDHDHDYDVIVTPPNRPGDWPGNRPGDRPRPEHPIARPSQPTTRPSGNFGARPMPSIPSAPRVSGRGGGGRR